MKQLVSVLAVFGVLLTAPASAELFLVTTADGPGLKSSEEAAAVLENGIIPTFEALMNTDRQEDSGRWTAGRQP